jgi:hypothetical protein
MRHGVLVRIARGVYARARPARQLMTQPGGEHALRLAASIAVTGPGTVGSHQSAAQLHGLDLIGVPDAAVTLTRGPQTSMRARPGIRLHAASLPAAHIAIKSDLPVTTVARTVIDMARTVEFKAGVVIADSALRKKLTSKEELRAVLATCRRWPGALRAAEVVEFADQLSESALESIGRVAFRDCELPPPELQAWVGGEELIGRADFFWREFGTIAEADGALKYADSGQARARAQLRRDAKLREAGFEVVHFDWQQIYWNPARVAAAVHAAFDRARMLSEMEKREA